MWDKLIDGIVFVLDYFFRFTDRINVSIKKLEEKEIIKSINKQKIYIFFIAFLLVVFVMKITKNKVVQLSFFFICFGIYIVIDFLTKISNMFKSVKDFFKVAFSLYFSLVLLIVFILLLFLKNINFTFIVLLVIIATFIWIFINSCIDLEVSIMSNAILTTINVILLQVLNYLDLIGLKEKWEKFDFYKISKIISYKELKIFWSSLFLYTSITLGITTLICSMKKYWKIKKEMR